MTMKIYPNPPVALATLKFEAGRFTKVSVWDINGKLLQQFNLGLAETGLRIDFSHHPSSTFVIELKDKDGNENAKVFKK